MFSNSIIKEHFQPTPLLLKKLEEKHVRSYSRVPKKRPPAYFFQKNFQRPRSY